MITDHCMPVLWQPPRIPFRALPQGVAAARAAYQKGYQHGRDVFGRPVSNPAGIDLADGVFWDDLQMRGNDWVTVTYHWQSGPPAPARPYAAAWVQDRYQDLPARDHADHGHALRSSHHVVQEPGHGVVGSAHGPGGLRPATPHAAAPGQRVL